MKALWQSLSLTYKLFISLLVALTLVLGFVSLYVWQYETTILIQKEQKQLDKLLQTKAQTLQKALEQKAKETRFLSSIELMDDLIANDVDKRISQMLTRKANDLGEGISFLNIVNQRVVASSLPTLINTAYTLPHTTYDDNYLYFQAPVHASFDPSTPLGTLIMRYPLTHLKNLIHIENGKHLWLSTPVIHPLFDEKTPSHSSHLLSTQKLSGILDGWSLHLAYDKEKAFETISSIKGMLFYTLIFSLLLLISALWLISKGILQNIATLTRSTEALLKTKQYKSDETVQGEDEIEKLSHNFDTLIKQTDSTQEALEAKTMFLSTISHELRTPLGSILTLTQHLMLSQRLNQNDEEMLSKIETSATHLLGMINNILDISKLESNTIIPHPQPTHLPTLMEEIYEMIEPLAEDKNLHLSKHIDVTQENTELDQQLFKQVVINLLSNALKFTHKGKISLNLTQTPTHYELTLTDTGIGIERERLSHIFETFYQSHVDVKHVKDSSGLGLALSKKVALLLGGDLEIESEGKDKGVKLTFTFLRV